MDFTFQKWQVSTVGNSSISVLKIRNIEGAKTKQKAQQQMGAGDCMLMKCRRRHLSAECRAWPGLGSLAQLSCPKSKGGGCIMGMPSSTTPRTEEKHIRNRLRANIGPEHCRNPVIDLVEDGGQLIPPPS